MTPKSEVIVSSIVTISTMLLLSGYGTININPPASDTPRQMENLGRGLVAINQGNGNVFVSWRMLGTDPDGIAFNLYRVTGTGQPVKLNQEPITKATYYRDIGVDQTKDNAWFVRPIVNGVEGQMSKPFLNKIAANAPVQPFFEIPLRLPERTIAGDGSVGDLDGDGEYEIVVKGAQRPLDTASTGLTGNTVLQAYKLDGALLWTISMGKNIREGEHDTQFMVYDLDGDGRAEVAVRTADGTMDGTGKVSGDPSADWVDRDQTSRTFGKIMKGPEYFSIFNGQTGAEMARAEYIPTRYPLDGWGGIGGNGGMETTPTGNRMNRFLACVAYLDGERPSVIMCRGYYGRTVLAAWDWRNRKLTSRWVFDSSTHPNQGQPYVTTNSTVDAAVGLNKITDNAGSWDGAQPGEWMVWDREGVKEHRQVVEVKGKVLTVDESMTSGMNKGAHVYGYSGMGNHNLAVADVDGDGKDEIVYGAMVVDDNGKGLFTNGLRHGDSLHVGDLDPGRPGLEVFGPHENEGGEYDKWTAGAALYDARTGKILWGTPDAVDVGGGVSGDVDPRYPGEEMWGIPGGLHSCKGETISSRAPVGGSNSSFVIWWDGDPLREVLGGNRIFKWDWQNASAQNLLTAERSAGGRPVLSGDLFGDWREEVIFRTTDSSALRIYTTTDPTEVRIYTLMHDPQYRLSIVWQNVAYNQPPHPSFFIGNGMKAPPRPNITLIQPK
jgi:rhamnogalacturonan endolyase